MELRKLEAVSYVLFNKKELIVYNTAVLYGFSPKETVSLTYIRDEKALWAIGRRHLAVALFYSSKLLLIVFLFGRALQNLLAFGTYSHERPPTMPVRPR